MNLEQMEQKPIWKLLAGMSLQTTFSLLVYSVYTFTDTWVVTRWGGIMESAGIGILSPVFLLLSGVAAMLGTGAASMLSRALGAGRKETAAQIVVNAVSVFVGFAVIFTALGECFLADILRLLGAEGEIYRAASEYGRIVIAGAAASTGFSSLMRGAGNLAYATFQWSVSILVNLCGDMVFVCGMDMGAEGAAWGTLLSQVVSAVTSLYYFLFYKKKPYAIKRKDASLQLSVTKEILVIGCPVVIRQIGNSITATMFQRLVLAAGGSALYGSYVIAEQIIQILLTPHTGIAQGLQPLAGYYDGREERGRKRRVIAEALVAAVLYGIFSMVIGWIGFSSVFRLFSDEESLIAYGRQIFGTLVWMFPFKGMGTVLFAFMQSEGRSGQAWKLSVASTVGIPLPCIVLGYYFGGADGIWNGLVLAEILSGICAVSLSRKEKKDG